MSITMPSPTIETFQALRKGLSEFLPVGDSYRTVLARSSWPGHALEMYRLGLQSLTAAAGLGGAKVGAWRFVSAMPNTSGIIVDVAVGPHHRVPAIAAVHRGPHAKTILDAAFGVERRPELQSANYELVLLSIPVLLIESFWLRCSGTGGDWIYPFHVRSGELARPTLYRVDEFVRAVQPVMKRRGACED